MTNTDYKEKIKKLLALSESDNENEARAALLKAKELMAAHKLTEAELKDIRSRKVRKTLTDITCSKRREPWIVQLSGVIGENYCCQAYRSQKRGKQTVTMGFVGLEDDIDICITIFGYAVDCIRTEQKKMKRQYIPAKGYASMEARKWVKNTLDSYGLGFAIGVKTAFERQKKEKELSGDAAFAVVMAMPTEVKEACAAFACEEFRSAAQKQVYAEAFQAGLEDGEKFDPGARITGEHKTEIHSLPAT